MDKVVKSIRNVKNSEKKYFILLTFLYVCLFLFLPIIGDDASLIEEYSALTIRDYWRLAINDYFYWSSRVIVNFVIHFVLGKGKYVWIILNAFVCYALCQAYSRLFVSEKNKECNLFIAIMIASYPIAHLGSAGWMITYMTYFWPMAMGFVALVPIAKIERKETISKIEYFAYSMALLYAANEELELVVLLAVYLTCFLYFVYKKNIKKYFLLQILLLIASLIFTLTCPGNGNRSTEEIGKWFKNYKMMSPVDKIDIGFTSTMQETMYGSYVFFIIACAVVCFVVWKKYQDNFLRYIALIPVLITTLLGPFRTITLTCFNRLGVFVEGISGDGLITISSMSGITMLRFFIMCFFAVSFMISVFLCLENLYDVLISLSLLISGTASRVAMGFSPTVHASGFRTATPMWFGIIGIGILVFAKAVEKKWINEKESKVIIYACIVLSAFAYLNCGIIVNG